MNILITSAGRRVSLVRAFRKEARKVESESKIFTVDLNPGLSSACQISDRSFKVPKVTSPDYISTLTDLCADHNVDLLIPTIDPELPILSENKEQMEKSGVKVVVSQKELVKACQDKRNTIAFFEEKDIPTPQIIERDNLRYPIYAKPCDGSSSENNYVIKDASELRDYHLEDEKLLFFEYLDHQMHDEYTLDLYYDRNSDLKCVVPRKRIEVRGGEVNKGLTEKNLLVTYVKEKLGYISGARGCLTLQLFLNKETQDIHGIEINPRFGGGYPLSYLSGANFPKWLIEEYLFDQPIEYYEKWEANLLMLRYDDEVLVHGYGN
ncbi:ATP-grasp domain-containing protein [Aliifodinibius salicampi]|uniref:ATP-grasp domain-containing protein n=1 Tax=Fodinibius salicampi TaxID=1920655 RepID=A0ABT3PYR5_9BACT|nr:ATP-grasp domain-containing protein [Fodinibius salicampi]MCW9712994.1 ATP-grasp domain-containing protein [Fodinibius salicampi]